MLDAMHVYFVLNNQFSSTKYPCHDIQKWQRKKEWEGILHGKTTAKYSEKIETRTTSDF